jgi:hypothetical protein
MNVDAGAIFRARKSKDCDHGAQDDAEPKKLLSAGL